MRLEYSDAGSRRRGRPIGSKDLRGLAQRVDHRVIGSEMWRRFCVSCGLRLRLLRRERQISAAELAAAIGAHVMTVLAWERGRSVAGIPTLVLIAAALQCSVVELLPDEAHYPPAVQVKP